MARKTPICNYCRRPAVRWFKYRGYIDRGPCRRARQPVITVAACDLHRACNNYVAMDDLKTRTGMILERGGVALDLPVALDPVLLLQGIQDACDYCGDRFAVQKIQNIIHYLTAPKEYADCYAHWGSLEPEEVDRG